MTDPHICPFTAGDLLALGAIASTSRAPGGPRLADLCFNHAEQHRTPPPDTEVEES